MGSGVLSRARAKRRIWRVATVAMLCAFVARGAVRLNEVMASNTSVLADEDGDFSDWIELVNTGDASVSLAGWGLSDDADAPFRWTFPTVALDPGVHLLVWASNKDRRPAVLQPSGLLMIAESSAWKYWDAGAVPEGAWQTVGYDDAAWPAGTARFGYPLAVGGTPLAKSAAGQFYPSYFFRKSFVLDAVPSAEGTGAFSIRHHFDDGAVVWLNGAEVYRYKMPEGEVVYTNYTGQGYNVDYNGSWLTNVLDKAQALALLRPGTNVCAVSLHQSKETTSDALFDMGLRLLPGTNTALHTNFKVSASGCDLYLTAPDGTLADHVGVPVMPTDYAVGRAPDGGSSWRVFTTPTPGTTNAGARTYAGVVSAVRPSVAPGFYSNTVTLALSTATPDAAIYYTTDGSAPTAASARYTAPLTLTDRSAEPNLLSLINTGNAGVFTIPSFGTVSNYVTPRVVLPKARTIRAVAVKDDWLDSPTYGGTWFVGPESSGYTLPVFSLMSDTTNFFGSTGIYGNPSAANTYDWEYPVNVELFESGAQVADQVMGFRIHGGYSSGLAEKTLRFYARSDYGDSAFDYPLFPDQPQFTSYRRFLLRNGGNDWARTLMRDALAQELCKHLRHDTQAYRPSLVFLNGEYWGIHNMRERYDPYYLQRVYGTDPDNVDIIGFPYGSSVAVADEGSAAGFNALLGWLSTNALTSAQAYAAVTGQVDVANYMDYMIANMFVVNRDWPGNNIKFWRTRSVGPGAYGDARWRYLMFDADFAFAGWDADPVSQNMWAWVTSTSGSGRVCEAATRLFRRLLENDAFRLALLNRYADQLNTAYLPHRVRSVAESMRDALRAEMPGHINRWPGGIRDMATWTNEVERACVYARDRYGWVWRNTCTYFSLTTGEVVVATSDIRQGVVQVNDVVVDADTLGLASTAAPYPWRGIYFQQVPVTLRACPRAGYRFVRWSESGETNRSLSVSVSSLPLTRTALFEPDPDVQAGRAAFLPEGEEDWDDDSCWSTGLFPNWQGAVASIAPPTVLDEDGLPRRNVRLAHAPVTVGHVTVENGAFSNRIRNKKDAPPFATLTFDGGDGAATFAVLGSGTGFTAVEVVNGVRLATDLRLVVSNTVGDPAYGALRLQAGWSGPGGLIKEGPGVCSMTGDGKCYAGRTEIREGVLSVTQPAAPAAGEGVWVAPSGQLLLTSGTEPGEAPRMYAFGGSVSLASLGRVAVSGVDGAGAKGGLRYDPGGQTNAACLLSPVTVDGVSRIHVDDPDGDPAVCNTLALSGALSGTAEWTKSGDGRLVVAGDASAAEGAVTVESGWLQVDGDMRAADVALTDDAWLCGTGRVGRVSGTGCISPRCGAAGCLTAKSVGGDVDFAFCFASTGEAVAGNDRVLLTLQDAPFFSVLNASCRISVYLDTLPPEDGFARGAFATAADIDFLKFVALADWRFYVQDPCGAAAFEGRRYAPCDVPLTLGTVAFNGGRILQLSRPARGYAGWRAAHFSLAEQCDWTVSDPLAQGEDGVANLLRYALGVGRTEAVDPYLPQFRRESGAFLFSFRKLTDALAGIDYVVVTSDDVSEPCASWQNVFDVEGLTVSLREPEASADPEIAIETLEIVPGVGQGTRFFRLRVVQP